jgi:hypothetical protein
MSLVLDWLDAEASTGRIESVARMTVRRAVSFFFMGFSFQGLAAGESEGARAVCGSAPR